MAITFECVLCVLYVLLVLCYDKANANAPTDIRLDEKARGIHRIDSQNILAYVCLLILTVCTIWLFKRRRARFLHETGLAIIYGLVIGAIIRYGAEDTEISFVNVKTTSNNVTVHDMPPDSLFFAMQVKTGEGRVKTKYENKTYAYVFRGEVTDVESQKLDQKATFDPEIFFNIILPPIIFNAGYSLKRRFFFRNLGAIMAFAFIGTTISCFVVGAVVYGFVQLMPHLEFTFNDSLYFGAIISATDPVTVLAIFHDLHVDVNLYALVFGESILNDAVAIVLSGAINNYEEHYHTESGFQVGAAFKSLGNFVYIFLFSFLIGSVTGCCTALLTKFTRLCDFPLLESSLFVLMSYSTFLLAEAADLSGIVAVLFCGICQAHYTFNNLSNESRVRTKQELKSVCVVFYFVYCIHGCSFRVGVDEEQELQHFSSVKRTSQVSTPTDLRSPPPGMETRTPHEKAWLVRKWYNFDVSYMKPLLTHSQPTLVETLPSCCLPVARILTTTKQMSQDVRRAESDVDLCIEDHENASGSSKDHQTSSEKYEIEGMNGAAPYGPHPINNTVYDGDLGLGSGVAQLTTTQVRIPGFHGESV
ncbi:sodium/hydrogen exchanger 7-like [Limulus polyphemus]|uniref:Sodium/hydrogen exchanger 7-like n=1 Tax=Limulus polyphemus TaxID=6850 RepID=A0ABM1SN87_LIMPO|nr:sodium/hydrogen exchanger 7-like [Limulus polyphemus]